MAKKNATIGIGLSVLASIGVASYMSGRRAVPSWSGMLQLDDLDEPVEVIRDRWGIPAIFAQSERDLFFVQGWLHASDRLFQLDLYRRAGYGRLAEVVGEPALASDKLVRTLNFGAHTDAEFELLDEQTRTALEDFARGVNAYIHAARRKLPVEFRLLGYRPEPWLPAHSLITSRLMALGLCGNWEAELARAEIAQHFGDDVLGELDHDADAGGFPAQIDVDVLGELASAARDATATFGGGGGIGSNNWVIGPRRTKTGGALLANDPHLELSLPSIWYENVLHSPTFNVRGFSIPGSPGVVLGHNGTVAWGFTNSCADSQDLYVEQLDEQAGTYRDTDGTDKPLETRVERIKVKGADTVELTVRSTRRGPLLTDAVESKLTQPLSMRWPAIGPGRLYEGAMKMNRAKGWEDFRTALQLWSAPAQNVVYADTSGNIGFQHAGEIPIRASGNGTVPRKGDDPEAEWTGSIPYAEMPWSFNPASDRIVTANDKLVGDDYPYFLSVEWMNGYRGQRIRELIDERDGHTPARQLDIQCDVQSLPGRQFVDLLTELRPQPATPAGREVLDALYNWNCVLEADDDGAIAYRLFLRALQEQVYGFLGELLYVFLGYSRTGMNGYWSLFARSTPRLVRDIREGDTTLLDLGARVHGKRDGNGAGNGRANGAARDAAQAAHEPIAGWRPTTSWREALEAALDRAGGRYSGEEPVAPRTDSSSLPRGGKLSPFEKLMPRRRRMHRLRLQHPLGVVPGLASVANYGPIAMPGDADTVWQASAYNNPMNEHAMVGPSHRHVVDLANLDASLSVVAGGQSGHPASPHYKDQVALWRAGRARPAPWSRQAIERAGTYRQRFEPTRSGERA